MCDSDWNEMKLLLILIQCQDTRSDLHRVEQWEKNYTSYVGRIGLFWSDLSGEKESREK